MNTLILVRHAHAASNADDTVNSVPPGGPLSPLGRDEARALAGKLASERIDLGVSSRLLRAQETLRVALEGRVVPIVIEPLLDEIGFGSFEGGPLATYRAWAWANAPSAACPGDGESRTSAALRCVDALHSLLVRPEATVLAVSHALPIRYVLDASDGRFPSARVEAVTHATPYRLGRAGVERAAETLRRWAEAPVFAGTPFGG